MQIVLSPTLTSLASGIGNPLPSQNFSISPLDPYPYNSLQNGNGPVLHYNASAPELSYNLTSPAPRLAESFDEHPASTEQLRRELQTIASADQNACQKCLSSVRTLKLIASFKPVETFTELLIDYCSMSDQQNIKAKSCHAAYAIKPNNATEFSSDAGGLGPYYALLFANINPDTGDDQALCHYHYSACDEPAVPLIDESLYFSPKPDGAHFAPEPSRETLNVLHISDTHLDPRYDIGSEADCTNGLCCRPYAVNEDRHTGRGNPALPASRYGSLLCDTPADLLLSSFQQMDQFMNRSELDFTIFTGDIVSHDNDDQLSRTYVSYLENATYRTFQAQLPGVPIYATLGNHDTLPVNLATPNFLDKGSDNMFSWNYNLLSSLWRNASWLPEPVAKYAARHYGGYAVTTPHGLRVISLNTDFWYNENIFDFLNFTNPDPSGTLKFLADELAACEKRGQRAWIIGHVLSGYTGEDALPGPAGLLHAIVARFAPRTIAAIYFGHSHMDQMSIFYDFSESSLSPGTRLRNVTDVDLKKPIAMAHVGPSITPRTHLNAGYQILKVDKKTFSLMDRQTYYADIATSLDGLPRWQLEYDARETYRPDGLDWPNQQPLNATFFHAVVEAMESDPSLMDSYNIHETKRSRDTGPCTGPCAEQKRCFIRSASSGLSRRCT